jgi:hypothetical protein
MPKTKNNINSRPPTRQHKKDKGDPTRYKCKRAGRKRIKLNESDILKLAQCGLTDMEICQILNISLDKLNQYRSIIQEGRAQLSQSIKRTQLELALKERDKTMLIWVGKQYAQQRERQELEHSGEVNSPQIVFYGNREPLQWENAEEIEAEEIKKVSFKDRSND